MDEETFFAEVRGLADLIRSHVMYTQEYPQKRTSFHLHFLELMRQHLGVRLSDKVHMELEILLEAPDRRGIKRILNRGRRLLKSHLNNHPDQAVVRAELGRWDRVLATFEKGRL